MGGQFTLKVNGHNKGCVYAFYRTFELLRGCLIRATIGYLIILSAKNISKQLLIDEHIIDADSDEAEDILIPNYRFRIDSAISLLQSWCRQPTKSEGFDSYIPKFTESTSGGVPMDQVCAALERHRKRREAWDSGPWPMADSLVPAGVSLSILYDFLGDLNYSLDRITHTLPPVLRELNLQGLHTYLSHSGEIDFVRSQEIAALLDKVMDYVRVDEFFEAEEEAMPTLKQLRDLFAACPQGGKVIFG
jgi:hypothetical protein